MADDESPRPFRRERNLSNRNFNKRGSRRRFSTESHSSIDSQSLDNSANVTTTTTATTTSTATTTDDVSSSSNSMHISYSVNSESENAFNRKSLLKMRPASGAPDTPTTPDPAMLGVKQKVLRFENLQAEDRIIFKTGKFKSKSLQQLANASSSNVGYEMPPLRVLPVLVRNKLNIDNAEQSPFASARSSVASFHTSIDEERSEDEVDDFSDYAEDEVEAAHHYILPEEASEAHEEDTPIATPGFEYDVSDNVSVNVPEFGIDDFGKVESVRRISSEDSKTINAKVTSVSLPTTPMITPKMHILNHSSVQAIKEASVAAKDFPRNYRSTPRPKTEIIGTKNRHVIGKFHSLHKPRETEETKDNKEEEEDEIELRDKCDKFIHPILEELIKTEETYVENLFNGIKNYGNIFQRKDVPPGLRGKKYVLLGNIEQIAEFHRDEFLPMLQHNRRDLKRLFDEFQHFIDQHCFYGYVIFTMNKQRSLKLCEVYKNYFKLIQSELDDKLGINSFLVQPIQRMARYPLLLQQFISTLFKNRDFVMKPLIESCCRLEKKLRTLLTTTNESEVINDIIDCNEFNVFFQGKFRRVSDFNVFDHTLKRSYRSKVFIFDKCIIYTEIKGKSLIFRGRYPCEHVGVVPKIKLFTLFYQKRKQQECDFNADPVLLESWLELIRDMINSYVNEERHKLAEHYSRESDHLHRKPTSLSLFRDSNRFSSDSGIGNIWVMPRADVEETAATAGNRTTWYAVS